MSVALATLFLKKGPFGLVITLPVAIATYFMWGRPYGGITFILEILVLTLIRNSPFGEKSLREGTILIYDFIYWATIGAPFYYLAYFYLAHQANETSLILAQKSIVNGVINSLIAYIIYAAITMTANNRSNHNQSVSIQALALATIYSVIVFVSLFMADMLYGSVLDLKANSLYKEVEPFSSFILKNTYGESLGRIDTELDYNLQLSDSDIFFKEKKSSEEIRISKGALQHKNFNKKQMWIDSTFNGTIGNFRRTTLPVLKELGQDVILRGNNVGHIFAETKPHLVKKDKGYYAYWGTPIGVGQWADWFFTSLDLPKLHVKQCHMVKDYFKKHNPTETNILEVGQPREQIISACRFDFDNNFQPVKTTGLINDYKNLHSEDGKVISHLKKYDEELFNIYTDATVKSMVKGVSNKILLNREKGNLRKINSEMFFLGN